MKGVKEGIQSAFSHYVQMWSGCDYYAQRNQSTGWQMNAFSTEDSSAKALDGK